MEDKNNLERFLRQQLQNYEAADNGWNVPPDDVWDNAIDQIPEDKNKRKYRFVWFWIMGLLMAGSIGYYAFHQAQQLKHLNEELNIANIALKNVQKEIDTLKYKQNSARNEEDKSLQEDETPLNVINSITKTDQVLDKSTPTSTSKPKSNRDKSYKLSSDSSNESTNSDAEKNDSSFIAASESTQNHLQKSQENEQMAVDSKEDNSLLAIQSLDFLPVQLDPSAILLPTLKLAIKQPNRISIEAQGTPLLLKRQVKNSNLPNAGFANQNLSGFDTGIHIGLDLTKEWSIETGINYFGLNIENERKKRISFDASNETLNSDGLLEFAVPSENINGLGSSNGELVFVRSSSDFIPNGTQITATIGSKNEINHLEIPLIFSYKLLNRRIMVNLQAGLVWSQVLNQQSEFNNVVVNNPSFTFNRGTTSPINGINQQTFSYQLGIGLEYRLNKCWSFTLKPIYQKGLQPHIEFKNGTQLFLEKTGGFVGLKYRI